MEAKEDAATEAEAVDAEKAWTIVMSGLAGAGELGRGYEEERICLDRKCGGGSNAYR